VRKGRWEEGQEGKEDEEREDRRRKKTDRELEPDGGAAS
jgi:hypothetical protein